MKKEPAYDQIIEAIFFNYYKENDMEIFFIREDIVLMAKKLGIDVPKNLGDLIYTFRYRKKLPKSIQNKAPKNYYWTLRSIGTSKYQLYLSNTPETIKPNALLAETKILDSTPGIITKYAINDEQGLLAKLRYNRLIDTFTGITCYSLQSHLRTSVAGIGQIETDEIYVGVDKKGIQYIIPVQAKGRKDKIGIVQIEQDIIMCRNKFPYLICISVAAQLIEEDLIALFTFELTNSQIKILSEKHYHLVKKEDFSSDEIEEYKKRCE